MPKPDQQQRRSDLGAKERQQKTMETTSQSQGNGGRQRRRIRKRRKSPVSNGLRDRTRPKPIEMRNLYAALNSTEALNNENDHIMVTIRLHGTTRQITINAMIDSEQLRTSSTKRSAQIQHQNNTSKDNTRSLPGGRSTQRYGTNYPYSASTYGHW